MISDDKIIYIDIGSSRIKYRYKHSSLTDNSLKNISEITNKTEIIYYSSVRSESETNYLINTIKKKNRVIRLFRELKNKLKTNYDISLLGDDRGLAILLIMKKESFPSVILDAGTAITIDFIDSNGLHLGGFIFPGISYSLDNLLKEKSFKTKNNDYLSLTFPLNTSEALSNYNYLIGSGLRKLISDMNFDGSHIYISGGDQGEISRLFKGAYIVDNIVLDSLEFFAACTGN